MPAYVLQHAPFEGPGTIAPWLVRHRIALRYVRLYEGAPLPELRDTDLLIVMGGPMSVNDENLYPWLVEEKRFIGDALERGVRVLGICLGAQLIASAAGSAVYKAPHREIGWHPARGLESGTDSFAFPGQFTAFHWHGETFDLPAGAVLLASSQACVNQAFQLGRFAMGLQFHLEVTRRDVRGLLRACPDDLVPGPYVQRPEEMMREIGHYGQMRLLMDAVLTYLLEQR